MAEPQKTISRTAAFLLLLYLGLAWGGAFFLKTRLAERWPEARVSHYFPRFLHHPLAETFPRPPGWLQEPLSCLDWLPIPFAVASLLALGLQVFLFLLSMPREKAEDPGTRPNDFLMRNMGLDSPELDHLTPILKIARPLHQKALIEHLRTAGRSLAAPASASIKIRDEPTKSDLAGED